MIIFEKWNKKSDIYFKIANMKKHWSINGVGRIWRISTNGANIHDKCFDFSINLGYIIINFILFDMDNNKLILLLRKIYKKDS